MDFTSQISNALGMPGRWMVVVQPTSAWYRAVTRAQQLTSIAEVPAVNDSRLRYLEVEPGWYAALRYQHNRWYDIESYCFGTGTSEVRQRNLVDDVHWQHLRKAIWTRLDIPLLEQECIELEDTDDEEDTGYDHEAHAYDDEGNSDDFGF